MSLAIWKWRSAWPFRSETRVVDSLSRDRAPLALTRFDARAVVDEIRRRFGDGDDAPFLIEVCDFTGERANWIMLNSGWSVPEETLKELIRMCADHGLHVYVFG